MDHNLMLAGGQWGKQKLVPIGNRIGRAWRDSQNIVFRQGQAEYRRRGAVGSNIRHEFAINPHTDADVAIDIRGCTCSQFSLSLTIVGWGLYCGAFGSDDGYKNQRSGQDLT